MSEACRKHRRAQLQLGALLASFSGLPIGWGATVNLFSRYPRGGE